MKNKAVNALLEMGMPADIKGFRYIVDAMCMYEEDEWRNGKITVLYYEIGRRSADTASRVERAIRHAFSTVLSAGDPKVIEKYLTLQRPTNGNLLHTLYLRLRQED